MDAIYSEMQPARQARPVTLPDAVVPRPKALPEPRSTRPLRAWQCVSDTHLRAAASLYHSQGYIVLNDMVEHATCDRLLAVINKWRPWIKRKLSGNRRNSAGTRYSINFWKWKFLPAWQHALHEILEGKTRTYIDAITGGDDTLCIDRLGGDCIEAGCNEPQDDGRWHSDWEALSFGQGSAHGVTLGLSLAVMDVTEEMGPTNILPANGDQSEASMIKLTMNKGAVLIRDIRVLHRGGANTSALDRVLPGLTLLTLATQLMRHKSMQAEQLRRFPSDEQFIPVWLRDYFRHSDRFAPIVLPTDRVDSTDTEDGPPLKMPHLWQIIPAPDDSDEEDDYDSDFL